MISVLLADDHTLVVEALEKLINQSNETQITGKATTLEQTRTMLEQLQPQVLLLDIAMPDGDGIDAIPSLRKLSPDTKIIILTMYAEAAVINRALHQKTDGYLIKSTNAQELIEAITTVANGDLYICPEAEQIIDRTKTNEPVQLTAREKEVLQLIVEGYTEKEIADKLYLSFETIHSYTKYLRRKLNCTNTASLVRTAITQHLTDLKI